ncbi:MAG: hypothetical protein IJG16_08470 [Clostridia bacterium]|nr:hypothetical protein [Clostridia bacterium]
MSGKIWKNKFIIQNIYWHEGEKKNKFIISFFVTLILFLVLLAYNHEKREEIITNIGIAIVAGILVYAVAGIIGHKYPHIIDEHPTPEPTQTVNVMEEQIEYKTTTTPSTIDFD